MGMGFIVAVVAGLLLAVQAAGAAAESPNTNTLVISALVALVIVTPLVAYGIYLYVKSDQEAPEGASSVEKQRQLMDVLRARGRVSIPEMAAALDLPEAQVRELVNQLIDLGIFTGQVDWAEEVLYAPESSHPRLD